MFKEFKEFLMCGNAVDMAVGIIMGAAFGTIIKSLVSDVIMRPIGLLLRGVDFSNLFVVIKEGTMASPYASLANAQATGAVTVNYGTFLNTVISFLIVSIAIFMLIKGLNSLHRQKEEPEEEPTTKDCPFCFSSIAINATHCPSCTSELGQP